MRRLGYICSHPSIEEQNIKCDRIRIGAISRLDDDENRAGLLLKPRCLAEEERATLTSVPVQVFGVRRETGKE